VRCQGTRQARTARRTAPGAPFATDSPEAIIGTVAGTKRGSRDGAVVSLVGLWAPAEGWEGIVEDITSEREGPALRLCRLSSPDDRRRLLDRRPGR
jgi:hypothetical protein